MALRKQFTIETAADCMDIVMSVSGPTIVIKQGGDIVSVHASWVSDFIDAIRELQDDLP